MPDQANSDENASKQGLIVLAESIETVRRGWRVVAISLVICMTLMGLYVFSVPRIYQATTRLLILQENGRPLNVANNDPTRIMEADDDFIPTQMQILSSPLVVQQAIDDVSLEKLPTLSNIIASDPTRRAVDLAIDRLKITRPDRLAKILTVTYDARSPEEAELLLKAITRSYHDVLKKTYQEKSGETIHLITDAKDKLEVELKELESQYIEFTRTLPFAAVDEDSKLSLVVMRLERSTLAVKQAEDDQRRLKYQLELGKDLSNRGMKLWSVAHAISQLGGDATSLNTAVAAEMSLASTVDYINTLKAERQALIREFGPMNTKAKEISRDISRLEEQARDSLDHAETGDIQDLLKSLSGSLKYIEELRKEAEIKLARELEDAKETQLKMLEGITIKSELDRRQALYETVLDQLKQATFVSDAVTVSSQVLDPARAVIGPISPRWKLLLAVSMVLGLAIGVGIILAMDRFDERLKSVKDLRAALGSNYLGQISQISSEEVLNLREPGLAIHLLPQSNLAEGYRTVRTGLELILRRNSDISTILVTSPLSGDGKSVTASNLAIAWSQVGRKVLLIDADLRRPSQGKILGVDTAVGLSDLLRDQISVVDAIRSTEFPNLDLMVGGGAVVNPAELLASTRLTEVLETLKGMYDLVILDSPPILAVSDPTILGSIVDGVVIVVRANVLRRHDGEIVKEWAQRLGDAVLGIVINGTTLESQGYTGYGIYGNYGYGGGYGGYGGSYGGYGGYGSYGANQQTKATEVALSNGTPPPVKTGQN